MRASRLLALLMHLQERGRASAPALAERVGVSVRTIYRDVDHLSAAGVPIWAEPGRQGGICLRPGWRTELTGLTTVEARALLLAGLPGPAAALGLGAAAARAAPKLLAALPDESRTEARRIGQRFHLDTTDWYHDAQPPACLQDVAEAVWAGRRIAVRYESWKRTSQRTLSPLGLVLKAGHWYLVAQATGRSEPATWRLAKVLALRLLDETFTPPAGFDLAAWWRASTARFEAGLFTARARLWVTEAGFEQLLPLGAAVAEAAQGSLRPCERAGWAEVEVPIESVAHAARQLLRLGPEAEVRAPAALRRALRASARRLARLYDASA